LFRLEEFDPAAGRNEVEMCDATGTSGTGNADYMIKNKNCKTTQLKTDNDVKRDFQEG
jgi:hypothetical protein